MLVHIIKVIIKGISFLVLKVICCLEVEVQQIRPMYLNVFILCNLKETKSTQILVRKPHVDTREKKPNKPQFILGTC